MAAIPRPGFDELWTEHQPAARYCDLDGWGRCSTNRVQQGIYYLGDVPGPGSCGRVSCSYNAAIYWCNDVRVLSFVIEPLQVSKSVSGTYI